MNVCFTKMQGAGNDYVYIDCTKNALENPSEAAVYLSDRHFGVGSDGLILIKKSDRADFFMEMYNADGSQGEMCGNGIRCVGKYVYDNSLTKKDRLAIDTPAGIKYLKLNINSSNEVESVRVDMGEPVFAPEKIPVIPKYFTQRDSNNYIKNGMIANAGFVVNGKNYIVTCISIGNPHVIVYLDKNIDIKTFEIEKLGPYFECHRAFPERVNTEFIQAADRKNLYMRVWERGSGETLACGTGACVSLVAAAVNGLCDDTAVLHLLGGDLNISWDRYTNRVYMEGPAKTVFKGEIEL